MTMKKTNYLRKLQTICGILAAAAIVTLGRPVKTQQAPAAIPAPHFHHVHLNSTNPAASIDYYMKAIPGTTKETVAGFEAVKTNNGMGGPIYMLFTKVNTPPATPDTVIWHFGWILPDSREALQRFHTMGLQVIPMYAAEDGGTIEITSDTFPGTLTKTQLADAKAKGVMPTKTGGYEYLKGPDGAIWENNGNGPVRFDHLHIFHENPVCAQEWYIAHLGIPRPPARGGGPSPAPTGDCKVAYGEPSWPAPLKSGFVRQPGGRVVVDDVGFFILPKQGSAPLAPTRGTVVDHMGLSVPDLQGTIARLKSEGVTILEGPHTWGNTRAAMIEGPDRVAIELVEVK
jgi:Glyoxalase/Bleomycin resistance protein/Dioxygenase superfamily